MFVYILALIGQIAVILQSLLVVKAPLSLTAIIMPELGFVVISLANI